MTTILIGPRSKRNLTHGMSMAFDLLIEGFEDRGLDCEVIDRSSRASQDVIGNLSFRGILETISLLGKVYAHLPSSHTVYITIGTSRAGLLKDILMVWPAKILKKRVVLHLHGGGLLNFYENTSPLFKFLVERTYNKADVLIVLGELLKDQFQYVQDGESKVKIVPNGLPMDIEERTPKKITIGAPIRLLYLSNLIPSKGYLDVLEACHKLVNLHNIPVRCDFCGAFIRISGEDAGLSREDSEQKFIQKIREYNLEDHVIYHGVVRGKEKTKLLEEAHILLLPTKYPWEGQPLSIIEALAFGTPVITTRYRGIPEQVKDGYNGYFVGFNDPAGIAEKVKELWKAPEDYAFMSQYALDHYQQHFTRKAHLDRLIPIILGLRNALPEVTP